MNSLSRIVAWSRRHHIGYRGAGLLVGDVAAWAVALAIAVFGRYEFNFEPIDRRGYLMTVGVAALAQLLLGSAFGLYTSRRRIGSLEEVGALVLSIFTQTLVLLTFVGSYQRHPMPYSTIISGGISCVLFMGGLRYMVRQTLDRRNMPAADATRVVVFGAGEGGTQAIDAMLRDPRSPYRPVAVLDDAAFRRNQRIRNVRVEGNRGDIARVAEKHRADTLLIAIPSASHETIRAITVAAEDAGLSVKVVPPLSALLGTDITVFDIRDISEDDLLGRSKVDTDIAAIAGYLTGKRVLVTGAGGSIGSELCRQISAFNPAELIMVDRDESGLHGVQLSIEGRATLDSPSLVLLNIRDRRAVFELFRTRRPDVVFHAAALKHLTLLERYPNEALKTNVLGTLNVLEAAAEVGVGHFVNISTDKAADPSSVLGSSKRVAERLTAHFGDEAEGRFLSVRFGNVLGSRGSVLTTFRAQAESGGPITVTHPEVTRFFMTISEAVQLVVQAGAIGDDGEVLVLDMGEPVRILDVAQRFANRGATPLEIVFTGLRPGEKLHETLFGPGENDLRPAHPLVSHVPVPPLEPAAVADVDCYAAADVAIERLRELCEVAVEPRLGAG